MDTTTTNMLTPSVSGTLAERLAEVNWDFPERVVHSGIEGIHPYPAKFIADIPRTLLDILPIPQGTSVFDPFCGSGTTLVESQRRGLPSVGIDLNPIACLIAQVKTSPNLVGLKEAARETVALAQRAQDVTVPLIPRLNHWFSIQVQIALTALSDAILVAPRIHQAALRLGMSSIVVRVSNQESDTRYAAIEKNISYEDVFSEFLHAVNRIDDVLNQRDYSLSSTTIIESDTLSIKATRVQDPIGIVITSPPYPNAYEYWLYHKYRMYWLGFDPLAVKAREIGARAHFFKRNHHTADDFIRQMEQTFHLIREVLVPGGYVCFVIGRSRIHGRIVDNAHIVNRVAENAGFDRIFTVERSLLSKRKSFNLSHANIKTESIIVLRLRAVPCA